MAPAAPSSWLLAAPDPMRQQTLPSSAALGVHPAVLGGVCTHLTGGGSVAAAPQLLFVGCYTNATPFLFGSAGAGILCFRVNPTDGSLTPLNGGKPVAGGTNPTYITASADGTRLYCGCEAEPSEVRSFAIHKASNEAPLTPLNTQPAMGKGACWVTLDHTGKYLLAANYTSGSVVCFPVDDEDGSLGPACDLHEQSALNLPTGPNQQRQEGPHAHCVFPSPTSPTHFYVPDLGLDKILQYTLTSGGKLQLESSLDSEVPAMGPRHFCFHPSGKVAFVINELGSTVTPLHVGASGALSVAGASVSTLPEDWTAATTARMATTAVFTERANLISHCAHIAAHPNGMWIYGSNRGHDSIATFAVDQADGSLTRIAITPTGGETPRNFQVNWWPLPRHSNRIHTRGREGGREGEKIRYMKVVSSNVAMCAGSGMADGCLACHCCHCLSSFHCCMHVADTD
eukprot:COSAG05_NODE_547_length_8758_cov_288.331447_2_plen_457_part_00